MARVKVGTAQEAPAAPPAAEWPRVLQCPHCNARMLSSQLESIDASAKRCIGEKEGKKCGAALSRMNEAQQLPVGQNGERAAPAPRAPAAPQSNVDLSALQGGFFGAGDKVDMTKPTEVPKPKDAIDRAVERKKQEAAEKKPAPSGVPAALAHLGPPEAFEDAGEEVEVTHPEEMYGMKGTFSSYRVGPFTARTRIRPGETRQGAIRRVLVELEEVAVEERIRERNAFLKHYEVAFVNG